MEAGAVGRARRAPDAYRISRPTTTTTLVQASQWESSKMPIKTLVAVAGVLAVIIVLFTITKVTTPSRFLAKA